MILVDTRLPRYSKWATGLESNWAFTLCRSQIALVASDLLYALDGFIDFLVFRTTFTIRGIMLLSMQSERLAPLDRKDRTGKE